MKNLIVLAVATLFATNTYAAEMKWNGSAGWRYSQTSQDDSLSSTRTVAGGGLKDVSTTKTRTHEMRANLGVMGGWEHVEYGMGLRTGTGIANSDYVTVQNNLDRAVNFDQAWFRYVRDFGSFDLAATIGRQKNALIYDSQWETLFDNDVRWDGFGWNFKFGMFGFNAVQYVLGGVNQGAAGASTYAKTEYSDAQSTKNSKFQMLYAFQPHMNWKFSDDIEAMFAVSYLKWMYEGVATNALAGGGYVGSGNLAASAGSVPAIGNGLVYKMDNKTQWDFLATVSLPYSLNLTLDYVKANKASATTADIAGYTGTSANTPALSSSAWTAGLTYGKLRKAQDFTLGYAYTSKGLASVIDSFTNDKFQADTAGHTILVGYSVADNFHLGFRTIMNKEKEGLDLTNAVPATAGAAYAGANSGQKMKINFWELTAGVAF